MFMLPFAIACSLLFSLRAEEDARSGCELRPQDSVSLLSMASPVRRSLKTPLPFPRLHVHVLTVPKNVRERNAIRLMWRGTASSPVPVNLSFVMCFPHSTESLTKEIHEHSDLLFLECEEGYLRGLLTLKVVAAMKAWRRAATDSDLFFKVDDDTFVHVSRFLEEVTHYWRLHGGFLYLGVEVESKERVGELSKWSEPDDIYPEAKWPRYMAGGPGYVLGKGLVARILDQGLPQKYPVWNEDVAQGVWIQELERGGVTVQLVNVSGTEGYGKPPLNYCSGPWRDFNLLLVHLVNYTEMQCLSSLVLRDDANADTHSCFESCPAQLDYDDDKEFSE